MKKSILALLAAALVFSACASTPSVPSITDRNLLGTWQRYRYSGERGELIFAFTEQDFLFLDATTPLYNAGLWGNDGNNKVIMVTTKARANGVWIDVDKRTWTFTYSFLSEDSLEIKDMVRNETPLPGLNGIYTRN